MLDILAQFGWDKSRVIDLGDIGTRAYRATAADLDSLWGAKGKNLFNFRIARGA
ncbi:MAG: hypothetical protein IPO19_14805 [Rhodoferax sp.]|nr:hypothetical protein [Rhodoferax sp.]